MLACLAAICAVTALPQTAADLPVGAAPSPVAAPHFPDRLHAFVWRNWSLVPVKRMAEVVSAKPAEIERMGRAMGLPPAPRITADQQRRSYLTVIRRNWHLLPYDQLLALLGWTPERMAYTLREDDFLFVKLGSLKPKCAPLRYAAPDAQSLQREQAIARVVHEEFPQGLRAWGDPPFAFVHRLSTPPTNDGRPTTNEAGSSLGVGHSSPSTLNPQPSTPRFCYSYFALYGDPLLDRALDPYPDGYLDRLAACGVNGVWLPAVLYKLAPFPWDAKQSERLADRLAALRDLVARAKRHGIGVYLYLNEPRAMPLAFFAAHPELKGVTEGDHAALCTSSPAVQAWLRDSVERICRAVPDLAGLFTITASENLTNCWSHGRGAECPRCGPRGAAEVIAEVNRLVAEGIHRAGSHARLIAWDWGWPEPDAAGVIQRLPADVWFMSVSEWDLPIERGGVKTTVGEYSLSAVGPGPRALRHWELARKRGLKTLAKIQASNSWELSSVPYVPAVENAAQHAANLAAAGVDGLMLGWTLGGYPSPNLEVVAEVGRQETGRQETWSQGDRETVQRALMAVAERRFGKYLAPFAVEAWKACSKAFREYPFHIGLVYTAPVQLGPANPLWEKPTGYHATMVGFPYDDLDTWRAVYTPAQLVACFRRMAEGFTAGGARARKKLDAPITADEQAQTTPAQRRAFEDELRIAEACARTFWSVANQVDFVTARRALAAAKSAQEAAKAIAQLDAVLRDEVTEAKRMYTLQLADSRLGFEASNQYYYVPLDLAEKVLNCRDLLDRWLPAERAKWNLPSAR